MVTKEQALTCISFKQIASYGGSYQLHNGNMIFVHSLNLPSIPLPKPINWRANGKCKTWKTRPEEFKLPIKHGLYSFGYITHENAHLFEIIP